jgi:AraC-like DNA-binding protein
MDILSHILRSVHLSRALYFEVHTSAPWLAQMPPADGLCARVMPDDKHVISFHIVLNGRCWAQLDDESEPAMCLDEGDVVIFARGDAHYLSSEPHKQSARFDRYRRRQNSDLPFVLHEFGGGERARVVCGYLGCGARPDNPILNTLPRLLSVRRSSAAGVLASQLVHVAVEESRQPRPGGETMLAKVGELMFLQAARQYIEGLSGERTGWLAALRDRYVSAALRAIHENPAEPWTLDALAREAGLSRSMLSERFSDLVGTSPMQYLSNLRLQLAASLLERQGASITRIAADVGYGSDAAFNRAFKRHVGVAPGVWRRRMRDVVV